MARSPVKRRPEAAPVQSAKAPEGQVDGCRRVAIEAVSPEVEAGRFPANRSLGEMVAAMAGIGPKDELEGMIAAQLLAAHNATMECYRRAMIGEQTFEGRRENLSQANKLSRTYAVAARRAQSPSRQGHAEDHRRA